MSSPVWGLRPFSPLVAEGEVSEPGNLIFSHPSGSSSSSRRLPRLCPGTPLESPPIFSYTISTGQLAFGCDASPGSLCGPDSPRPDSPINLLFGMYTMDIGVVRSCRGLKFQRIPSSSSLSDLFAVYTSKTTASSISRARYGQGEDFTDRVGRGEKRTASGRNTGGNFGSGL